MISNGMRLAVIATMLAPFACLCAGQEGPKANPADQVGQPTNSASTVGKEEADHPLAADAGFALPIAPRGLVSHHFSPHSGVQSADRCGATGRLCHAAGRWRGACRGQDFAGIPEVTARCVRKDCEPTSDHGRTQEF